MGENLIFLGGEAMVLLVEFHGIHVVFITLHPYQIAQIGFSRLKPIDVYIQNPLSTVPGTMDKGKRITILIHHIR